jgi:hypothetical protein
MTQDQQIRSDVLAWLNVEQRKADRWRYSDGNTGVYRFSLTGPELMRIRHALGASSDEWQCRFIGEDKRCCLLLKDHDGEHKFSPTPPARSRTGEEG